MGKKLFYLAVGALGTLGILAGIGVYSLYKAYTEKATDEEKENGFAKYIENTTKDGAEKAKEFSKEKIEKVKASLDETIDSITDVILPTDLSQTAKNKKKTIREFPITSMP